MSWIVLLSLIAVQTAPSEALTTAAAEGDRLLSAAGAADLFVNETLSGDGAILLRHKASGYRCVLNPGEELNVVRVYPNPVRGNDVSCTTRTITDARSTYFTRHTSTAESFLEGGAISIQARYPNAREVRLRPSEMALANADIEMPKPLSRGFETRESYEQITLGKEGDWVIKMRFSSAPGSSRMSEIYEQSWAMVLLEPRIDEIREKRGLPPIDRTPTPAPQ